MLWRKCVWCVNYLYNNIVITISLPDKMPFLFVHVNFHWASYSWILCVYSRAPGGHSALFLLLGSVPAQSLLCTPPPPLNKWINKIPDQTGYLQKLSGDDPKMSLVVRKPVFGVSDQVRHKPVCTVIEDAWRLEISDLGSRGIVLSVERKQRRWSVSWSPRSWSASLF